MIFCCSLAHCLKLAKSTYATIENKHGKERGRVNEQYGPLIKRPRQQTSPFTKRAPSPNVPCHQTYHFTKRPPVTKHPNSQSIPCHIEHPTCNNRITFTNQQSWSHRSLKLLNCSSLLSEPWFWERWRSLQKRAKRNERTDKIKFWAVRSWAI